MESKVKRIIDHLLSMTKDGIVEWQYANSEDSYKLELDSATLIISYMDANPFTGNEQGYSLVMYNGTGKPIDLVSCSTNGNPEDYVVLSDLYALAKESTAKIQSTLDKLLKELGEKDLPF